MPVVIEGCSEAVISFTRTDVTDSLVISFEISGDADNGIDYNFIADSVVFLAGQDSIAIVITPLIDGPDGNGQDTVIISYMNINACGDTTFTTGSFLILDVPNLVVNAPDTTICPLPNIDLNAEAFGAVAPFIYNWVDAANDTIQTDSLHGISTVNVDGMVSGTYYLYVTDSCNLTTTLDTINVYVNDEQASISTSNDTILYCEGQPISINAFPDSLGAQYDYEWFNQIGGTVIDNDSVLNVSPVSTITYYVTATNICNASTDTDTIIVTVDYTPMTLSLTDSISLPCPNKSYDVEVIATLANGTMPYAYSWNASSDNDNTINFTVNANQTVSLTVTDVCLNQIPADMYISYDLYIPMVVRILPIDSVCVGETIELPSDASEGIPPYSYSWTDGVNSYTGNPATYSSLIAGINNVVLTVTDDCNMQQSSNVDVLVIACNIVTPNVFTPNGDSFNETLVFENLEFFPNNRLVIFNRWGNKILEQDGYKNDWNGNGAPAGTYYYVIDLNNSENKTHKGTFTIFN